ncbi:hypothetical protein NC651_022760 [Populus alba x Populus x berolinensis]|nr:hypothetical protein NC651_021486 [Populus alba x Populus x berolinensis]KAJ6896662.1 hypothetical protein NC651_022755 [Populus alba x Populus x berolinensis]KAJ6896670.1 hypothetical protein NC651_022760 [Populus alba x Populus x berolinensis]
MDQTTGAPNMEKIVIMNAMKNNYFVKEYFDM